MSRPLLIKYTMKSVDFLFIYSNVACNRKFIPGFKLEARKYICNTVIIIFLKPRYSK